MSNYKTVFFTLGILQIILGLSMIVPILAQFFYDELDAGFIRRTPGDFRRPRANYQLWSAPAGTIRRLCSGAQTLGSFAYLSCETKPGAGRANGRTARTGGGRESRENRARGKAVARANSGASGERRGRVVPEFVSYCASLLQATQLNLSLCH